MWDSLIAIFLKMKKHTYFEIIVPTFFEYKTWIIMLQIMKHIRDIFSNTKI